MKTLDLQPGEEFTMKTLTSLCQRVRWTIVLAAALVVTANAKANENSNTFHYLAVGVSQYAHLSTKSQLRFAHQDARDLTKVWQAQQGRLYGQVSGETLIDGHATLDRILQGLDRLIANAKQGDVAVISLSGHGGFNANRDPNWYFLPHDCHNDDLAGTALSAATLRAKLTTLAQRGATVILILDACHSGGYGDSAGNIIVFASCMPHQVCVEGPNWNNGVYTRALIEALEGLADANRDGAITLEEIDAYVTNRVSQLLQHNGGGQSREPQKPTSVKPTSVRIAMPLARVATTSETRIPVSTRAN